MDHIISTLENLVRGHRMPDVTPLDEVLKDIPVDISELALKYWDKGVFNHEIVATKIAPNPNTTVVAKGQLTEGTYDGTQVALTEMFNRIERGYVTPLAGWVPSRLRTSLTSRLVIQHISLL